MTPLTTEEIAEVMVRWERLWRDRTPAKRPQDVLPEYKVGNSWTLHLVEEVTGRPATVQDRIDLQPHLTRALKRLKKEFPDLPWSGTRSNPHRRRAQ